MTCSAAMRRTGPFGAAQIIILLRTAKGPKECAHGHAGIEFLREPQPARMTGLVADFLGADTQIVVSIWAIRETRVGPPVFVPVAGIGHVGIGKSEVALGFWIVSRLMREIDLLSVPFFNFLIHMGHINGLLFVGRGRREQHKKVVTLLCRGLGSSLGGKVDKVDVVDDDIRIVLLSPLFAEGSVKPGVVRWDEMAPLKNFQRFLLSCHAFWEQKKRAGADAGCEGPAPRQLDKVPA